MNAIRLLARTAIRRHWRSVMVVALIAGIGAAFALTAFAGARRASTAWARLRAATAAPDVIVQAREGTDPSLLDVMRRQPGVAAAGSFAYAPVAPEPATPAQNAGAFVALDRHFGDGVYKPLIEAGRRPDPRRADEVTVNRALADLGDYAPGQRVRLRAGYDPDNFADLGEVTIVGIHKGLFDVGANAGNPAMLLGHRFLEAHRDQLAIGPEPAALIRLDDGYAGLARAQRQVQQIWGDAAFVMSAQDDETVVVDAVNVQVIALTLLAFAAGLATAVAAGQALGRLLTAAQRDATVLLALGLRRRDLVAVGAVVAAAIAALATAFALTGAVVASPLVPTGLARKVEPDPGVHVDAVALGVGAGILIALLVAAGAALAWRGARRHRGATRSVARPVPPLPLGGALGVHWTAARTPGPAAAAARSALAAATAGAAGVLAVVTFATSLSHFLDTDRLFGWEFQGSWVAERGDAEGLDDAVASLANDARTTDVSRGEIGRLGIAGVQIETWALRPIKGATGPTLLSGRYPAGADEIVLGTDVLRAVAGRVGDAIEVEGGSTRPFRIVGTAVFPELGNASDLSTAALVTLDGWRGIGGEASLDLVIARGPRAAAIERLMERNAPGGMEYVGPFAPPRVRNIEEVGRIPVLLAVFFATLALAAIMHALFLSVRHRRREIAVLRCLGMGRRRVRRAVAAQAVATVIAGAVVGVPLGIAVGRVAWGSIAQGLGVLNRPVTSVAAVAIVVVAGLVVAIAVAQIPAVIAGRLRPAQLLRTE